MSKADQRAETAMLIELRAVITRRPVKITKLPRAAREWDSRIDRKGSGVCPGPMLDNIYHKPMEA